MKPGCFGPLVTTASAAGYGLLALVGAYNAAGLVPSSPRFGSVALGLALVLVALALLLAAMRAGVVDVAWQGQGQGQGQGVLSWRDVVLASLTAVPAAVLAYGWVLQGRTDAAFLAAGLGAALLSLVALQRSASGTARPAGTGSGTRALASASALALAVNSGAQLLNLLLVVFDALTLWSAALAILAPAVAGTLKLKYWYAVDAEDRHPGAASMANLTAATYRGAVPPANAGRANLMWDCNPRQVAFMLAYVAPIASVTAMLVAGGPVGVAFAALGTLSVELGLLLDRWLEDAQGAEADGLLPGMN